MVTNGYDDLGRAKAHAAMLKLTGTPSFIANGVVIKGAQPLEYFTKVVERLLSEGK